MAQDTNYRAHPFLFRSKGIVARHALDRPPGENANYFLNMSGAFEREEDAISSRYGSTIINRDPDGTPGGINYPLPFEPVSLSRLKSPSQVWRYAGLSDGSLWRRQSDTQGQFTKIIDGLSGKPFSSQVLNVVGSATPYLFVYDRAKMLKDNGTGTPSQTGIFGPNRPVTATQYAPEIALIDSFQASSGYSPSGMSLVGIATVATISGTNAESILGDNYFQYSAANSLLGTKDGMISTSTNLADGAIRLKFNTRTQPGAIAATFDIVAANNAYSTPSDSFIFKSVSFSVGANTTGHIGKTVALDLSKYQSDDLIAIAINVTNPEAVQEIRVMFDVAGSGYGASYYYKSLIPVSYQGSVSIPQNNSPSDAVFGEVFSRAIGLTNISQTASRQVPFRDDLPHDDLDIRYVQPSQLTSGQGSWSVVYLRKGDFLPAGNAGDPGLDWASITGWRVQITTTSQGSTDVGFNALYIQGSPTSNGVGTNAGPSSYGGLGYDFRYTYWNNNTFTESNPSGEQYFSINPDNPGGVSTLLVLRQAIDLLMRYSDNPDVTHIRVYVRGGLFGENWFLADQIPNIPVGNLPSSSEFHYKYILPDSALKGAPVVKLDNDVPVTSTLPIPIYVNLTGALTPDQQGNTNVPTLLRVHVDDPNALFVPNQIVNIGTPQNLEQVVVVEGGSGTFTAWVQLNHNSGFNESAVVSSGANAGGGTWSDPSFITTPDGFYSSVYVTGNAGSLVSSPGYLEGTNCGFSVPAVVAITGIQVDIVAFAGGASFSPNAYSNGYLGNGNFINPQNAFDNDFATQATGTDNGIVQTPKACLWRGFPAAPPGASSLKLNINMNTGGGAGQPGTFLVQYSLDNGATFHTFPGVPTQGTSVEQTYSLTLPPGQDTTQVQIYAVVGWIAGSAVVLGVHEIWISGNYGNNGQFAMQLVKGGVVVGSVESHSASVSASIITFGGPSDLWGTTWTPADVNASNFGAALKAQIDHFAATIPFLVDVMRITVFGTGGTAQEPVQVFSRPGVPVYLMAEGYGQTWLAGDTNNPHYLYYTPVGYPENCPPQNYIPVGVPKAPITAVINIRGTIFVRTVARWWQIFPGSPPSAASTGCMHGSPANFDWCVTERGVWYQGWDGIRVFEGADARYESLLIEWLYRNNPLTPIPLVDLNKLADVKAVFKNNTATFSYIGKDGNRHRLRWNTNYKRWRNDDEVSTALFLEDDTNTLVYSKPYPNASGYAIVYEDINRDYDDGGWQGVALAKVPIPFLIQTPYLDQGAPNNPKQYNVLVIDADPAGQTLSPVLLFDDDNGTVPPVTPVPASFTGARRDKYQFLVEMGEGQEAYRISVKLTGNVIAAPIIYQADLYTAILPDWRSSFDSYWIKFGKDEADLVKQCYIDYTTDTNVVSVSIFADGNTIPYDSFVLPVNSARSEVPLRIRFLAMKFRLWRIVMTTPGKFRLWSPIQVDRKTIMGAGNPAVKGYARAELGGLTPP